ncbi:transmembrane protein 69-like [Scophthalmus maximus]|nr:transmembrane protein 69-like [Scophthalmus maximus]XP_035503132.1 transmembrane protein 69-like [Scophthalmus maximus]
MLAVIFRKGTFAARKVLHRAGPPQRCWTSALTGGAPDGGCGSLQTCWASSARLPPTGRDVGLFKAPAVLGVGRTEPFPRTQIHESPILARERHFHSSAARLKKRPKPEPPPRELDLLRYDMKDLRNGPKPALWLGFAGLIPFVSPTMLMAATECFYPELAFAQLAYGAAILSFLGGARWGFALPESSPGKPDWINLANSVVPALLAWTAMLMSDNIVAATTMAIMGHGVALHYDLSLLPTYPSWFKALRSVLTIVAFFSLFGTLVMSGLFPEKIIFSD